MQTQINKKEDEIIKKLQDIPDEQLPNLLNMIRIFKKSINMQKEIDFYLKKELNEWDILSDEALSNFEASKFIVIFGDIYLVEIPTSGGHKQAGFKACNYSPNN